jgi:histidinol-phosphate aminotransferase
MVRGSPGSSRHEAPNDHGRNAQIETLVVFFEAGQPHGVAAAQLINEGIEIARAFPPFDRWCESLLVPAENARARDAIKKLLG